MTKTKTVLVVEDDSLVRLTVCHYVHRCGWQAIEAISGSAALKVLEAQDELIDAVVADIALADISGADLPLLSGANCPFIFMTGGLQSLGNLQGPILRKPFDANALGMALELIWDEAPQTRSSKRHRHSRTATNLT